jgi:hypothetical protein
VTTAAALLAVGAALFAAGRASAALYPLARCRAPRLEARRPRVALAVADDRGAWQEVPLPPSGPIPGGLQRSAVEPDPGEDDLYFTGWYTVVPDDPAAGDWPELPPLSTTDRLALHAQLRAFEDRQH